MRRPASKLRTRGPPSTNTQRFPGVRMAIASPWPTASTCRTNASLSPRRTSAGSAIANHTTTAATRSRRAPTRQLFHRPRRNQIATASSTHHGSASATPGSPVICAEGTAEATRATCSIAASTSPVPPASTSPKIRLKNNPGTTTPVSGTATRLAKIPIGETVPNQNAVIGAVASVAPTDAPSKRHRGTSEMPKFVPHTAATDNHAPTDLLASGSSARTTSTATASTADGGGCRCLVRATPTMVTNDAALVAGAGNPNSPT